MEIFGRPLPALASQVVLGLVNGSFYAMLSLGLAVIFGTLNIVNFAHGAFYMVGAFGAFFLLNELGLNYWVALFVVPLGVGIIGMAVERGLLRHLHGLDPLYGLLLTFGLSLILEGVFRDFYGSSGRSYPRPAALNGVWDLGFMVLPISRAWVIGVSLVVCLGTWLVIEKTKLGSTLRAATENAALTQAFGVNVPLLVTLTFGFGVALAGLAGVLAAAAVQITPLMASNIIIVVFAVVVIGGMGSILGAILTGLGLGIVEGLTRVFYPEASATVVFVIMAIVLLIRPAGLFGRA
ncbi:MAG TPA: branched-chain amino acid ABC transporter permease [Beijerinckiaceae bacterium]|jgi:branched-chain amino acid transport system permease protein